MARLAWLLLAWTWIILALLVSAGFADDAASLQARINAAVSQGKPLRLEAQRYRLDISGKWALQHNAGMLKIVGEGAGFTVLETEPELTAAGAVIWCAAGTKLILEDLTIIGPVKRAPPSNLLSHYGGDGGELVIRRCEIRQGNLPIKGEATGTPWLSIEDTEIGSPCGVNWRSGRAELRRVRFTGTGGTDNKDHCIYTYNPVSLFVDACDFSRYTSGGQYVHPWSPAVSGKPDQFLIRDSIFPAGSRSILTHPEVPTIIRGCKLGTVEVQAGGVMMSENVGGIVKPYP